MGNTQTKTYVGIIPELNAGRGMAVYQLVALCGTTEEPTEVMKIDAFGFGRTFQKIEDRVFYHSPYGALFHDWTKEFFRPAPEIFPQIVKTSSIKDYPTVFDRLRGQYEEFKILDTLITGEEALKELRDITEFLRKQGKECFDPNIIVY